MKTGSRRGVLKALALGLVALPALRASRARAQAQAFDPGVKDIAKGAAVSRGRVKLELPIIAENGNAVPLKVSVGGSATEQQYVKSIYLISQRNPVKHMAAFHLSPRAGRAEIATRVRLAGSQTVTALAELSDGTFWVDTAHVQVTLSACMDES